MLLQGDAGAGFISFLPLILIAVLFWFLVLRPQQKEQRERADMQKNLARGDRVVSAGGMHGTVAGVEEQTVSLELANLRGERVRVKIDRAKIERKIASGGGGGADSSAVAEPKK